MTADTVSGFDLQAYVATLNEALSGGFKYRQPGVDDTTLVITATGTLDKVLEFGLTSTFYRGALSKTLMARVFEGYGPLASFASKIDVCHIQGFTSKEQHHDLQILRRVRNQFAHSAVPLKLADMTACDSLKITGYLPVRRRCKRTKAFLNSVNGLIPEMMVGVIGTLAKHQLIAENLKRYLELSNALIADIYKNQPGDSELPRVRPDQA